MTDVTDATEVPETVTEPVRVESFSDFPIHADIVDALAEHKITSPFPIQAMTLPVALAGHDIIGQAKTGTGKTLGFGIPILNRVTSPKDDGFATMPFAGKPQALAVAPTRELAVQVAGDLGHARIVVLDEADEMLDLGFLPDVERLLSLTPASRQTMLFSATMPGAVVALARRYMSQPTHIRAMGDDQENAHTVKAVEQFVYRAHAMDKVEMLARMLQARERGLTIIFSRTKRTAAKVADDLAERGFAAAAIHGDLGQGAREQALRAFRNGKVDILVATDVAARGIDVEHVTHVINYQCPEDEKTYLHRIGRTARAGNTGIAVTFVDWDDLHRWAMINKVLDLGMPEPQETYSSSPHLYSDLDIPEGSKGRLPRALRTREGLGAEVLEDLGETGKGAGRRGPSSGGGDRGGRGGHSGDSRGGRGGESRGDSTRPASRDGDATPEGADRPRRNRNRRRTRGGSPSSDTTS